MQHLYILPTWNLSGWVRMAVRTAAILSVGFRFEYLHLFHAFIGEKTFENPDTLNERTWELEKLARSALNIYEHAGVIGYF